MSHSSASAEAVLQRHDAPLAAAPSVAATGLARPKVLFLTTEDWYFWSHRLPMARAARDAGFDVGVATRVSEHADRIRAEGFSLHPLRWQRGSIALGHNVASVVEIAAVYRRERPAIVHHVAIKPIILGSLAASLAGVPHVINAVTGVGYLFTSSSAKARLLRASVVPLLRLVLKRDRFILLLQNHDDRRLLIGMGLVEIGRAFVIRGSGVDIAHFEPLPLPGEAAVTVAFAGRLAEIKGIRVLIEAHRLLRRRGMAVRLLVAGAPDPENPGSVPPAEVGSWAHEPGVEILGQCPDIRRVWERADIAVLPSLGGEGLPKSLLEAAACGRPLIATDIPGSREIAVAGRNALVVPPGDPVRLAEAIATLAGDRSLREAFARESRRIVESDMAQDGVSQRIVRLYRTLLASPGG